MCICVNVYLCCSGDRESSLICTRACGSACEVSEVLLFGDSPA